MYLVIQNPTSSTETLFYAPVNPKIKYGDESFNKYMLTGLNCNVIKCMHYCFPPVIYSLC